jgi:hypothetical protein
MEFIVVLAAAARFRRAWVTLEANSEPLLISDALLIEVNEAAQELMEATETTDLVATFDALGELVRQVSR